MRSPRAPRIGRDRPALDNPPGSTAAGPDSIDDLWHAALNSRGKFFNAANPQELASSIVSALNDFIGPNGTGTGVAIAGAIGNRGSAT